MPVLCLAAVVVKARQRRAGDLLPNYRSRTVVLLDGLIVIGSLFVLTWVSALESLTRTWAAEGAGFATVVAHPAAYLVLLVLADGGDADEIGSRLLAVLSHPHEVQGRVHRVHASIGVAQRLSYAPSVTADDVLGAAMYTAKRLGKGMVVVHGSPLPEMT